MKYKKPIGFLSLNIALSVKEKKFLNIIISDYFVGSLHSAVKDMVMFEKSISTHQLSFTIRKRCNDIRLNAKNIADQLFIRELMVLLPNGRRIKLIHSFTSSPDKIVITFNNECHTLFDNDQLFFIDIADHSKLKKKNTLTLYEICLSILAFSEVGSSEEKFFKKKDTCETTYSVDDLRRLFGADTYQNYSSPEFQRSVLKGSFIDLNKQQLGFTASLSKEYDSHTIVSYVLEIVIVDALKINNLLAF